MRFGLLDILSWAFAILTLVLVLWRIFGNSPSEWAAAFGVAGFMFLQIFNLRDRVTRLEMGMKNGFYNVKKDMDLMRDKLDLVCDKLEVGK